VNERDIQARVVALLRFHGVLFCHPANESAGPVQWHARRQSAGVEPGVPDILIFDEPRSALEIKASRGRLSAEQQTWLHSLSERGWRAAVAYGLDDAIAQLRAWGFVP
jgi:hypothetical protein